MMAVVLIVIVGAVITIAVVLGIVIVVGTRRAEPAQPPLPSHEARGGLVAKFECQECGAELDKDAVTDKQGFIFVDCSYCGSTYQLIEEPV